MPAAARLVLSNAVLSLIAAQQIAAPRMARAASCAAMTLGGLHLWRRRAPRAAVAPRSRQSAARTRCTSQCALCCSAHFLRTAVRQSACAHLMCRCGCARMRLSAPARACTCCAQTRLPRGASRGARLMPRRLAHKYAHGNACARCLCTHAPPAQASHAKLCTSALGLLVACLQYASAALLCRCLLAAELLLTRRAQKPAAEKLAGCAARPPYRTHLRGHRLPAAPRDTYAHLCLCKSRTCLRPRCAFHLCLHRALASLLCRDAPLCAALARTTLRRRRYAATACCLCTATCPLQVCASIHHATPAYLIIRKYHAIPAPSLLLIPVFRGGERATACYHAHRRRLTRVLPGISTFCHI